MIIFGYEDTTNQMYRKELAFSVIFLDNHRMHVRTTVHLIYISNYFSRMIKIILATNKKFQQRFKNCTGRLEQVKVWFCSKGP